ncbi:MAG: recombinase RecT [Burkholderiales bacterium]|nr:recombinase RecT [Burkholderiales bacterium]
MLNELIAKEQPTDFQRLLGGEAFSVRELLDDDNLDKMTRLAEMMAAGRCTVPKHFHGNVGDCLAIITQASQWKMNPFAVAQKTHIVNGTLGYEAQLVNAVIQNSGAIVGRFHYEYDGDGQALRCRVGAVLRGESAITWGQWLSLANVKVKNSPLWGTNPHQQLGYLQVKNWGRAFTPGAILGVYTADEIETGGDAETPAPRTADPAIKTGPRRKSEAPASEAPPAAPAAPGPTTDAAPPTPDPAPAGAITTNQVAYLRNKMKSAGVDEASIVQRYELPSLEYMNSNQFDEFKAELLAML